MSRRSTIGSTFETRESTRHRTVVWATWPFVAWYVALVQAVFVKNIARPELTNDVPCLHPREPDAAVEGMLCASSGLLC